MRYELCTCILIYCLLINGVKSERKIKNNYEIDFIIINYVFILYIGSM